MELKLTNKTGQIQDIEVFETKDKKVSKDHVRVNAGGHIVIDSSKISKNELERVNKFFMVEEVKKSQPVSFNQTKKSEGGN